MDDNIGKMILFGEDTNYLGDEDMTGLHMGGFGGMSFEDLGIVEDDVKKSGKASKEQPESKSTEKGSLEKKLIVKKKLGGDVFARPTNIKHIDHSKKDQQKNIELPIRTYKPQEKDLNIKLICVNDGEKIYKLSDLFIPQDERIIRRIEKYNNKIMTLSEKPKQEKDLDAPKKEISEADEIKHLIRKAKRNQKFTKINVTYNEKFFLENIATEKLAATTVQDNSNPNFNLTSTETILNEPHMQTHEGDLKVYSIPESKRIDEKIVESNLLNSLFYIKSRLKDQKEDENVEMEEETEINSSHANNFEEAEILNLNNSIKEHTEKLALKNTINNNPVNNQSFVFNDTFINNQVTEYIPAATNNLTNTIFLDPDFKKFSLNNSDLFKDAFNREKEKNIKVDYQLNETIYGYQESHNEDLSHGNITMRDLAVVNNSVLRQQAENVLTFKQEKDSIDAIDLYDLIKRKRHRAQGYSNEQMLNGAFLQCIILDDQNINNNFKEISKRVFDMNDYNMNFEVLKQEAGDKQKKEQKETLIKEFNQYLGSNGMYYSSGEDFFTNLINQKLVASTGNQQPVLKIGKAKGNLLTHAKCAYNLTYNKINLTYEDLKDFHRPNFCKYLMKEKKKRNFSITINDKFNISSQSKHKRWDCQILTRNYLKKREKKRISKNIQYMNAYEIFKDRYKLSLVDGKYCLFEHIDENPLFVSNFGMASKLKKFLYSPKLLNANVSNSSTKLSETELKTYNIIGPYGIQIPLQTNQKLPLIGQIDQNELKGLAVTDNKMYRAPVFYEKVKNPTTIEHNVHNKVNQNKKEKKYFNFLITFKKTKEGKEGFYIRELDHHYTVAQEEPKIEVYPPQSRQYLNFFKNKIKTYTYKLYDEIGYKAGINFKVFTNLFPNATEQILKKNFREMKIEIDKNICYFTKLPNEDNQMLITPENVCQFESCQFGIYKLREVGIKNLTNPDKISYATNKFINQTQDLKKQFLGRVIEEELLTTPWNITQNYLQAKQIKGMLAIKGIGDPSNGNGGYSFLKMPVKTYNDNKTLKEEIDQLKTMNKNIKTVTGTDADLRKLSKDDIKLKLIQLGEDEEYINKLSRWERVSLLRYKSSKAAELGYEGDITKYARGTRMSSKLQRDAYQKNINEVFKKQIHYITSSEEINQNIYSDDSSDEDEDKIEYESSQIIEEPEEEDKKKGLGFMRNEIYTSNNNKKKKKESRRIGIISHDKRDDGKIIKVYNKNTSQHANLFPDEISTKIKFDMKNVDMEYLNRKKKNSQSFDNVYEYEIDKASTLVSRKRRDTPEKMFNELIEDIIDSCIKFDLTKIFHQPVKKKEYPDYYDIVKSPIDLGSMKNKTKRNEYSSISQFISDLNLMVQNSSIYNGDTHDVTLQGQKILNHAFNKLSEHEDRLKDMEMKLNDGNYEVIQS